MGRGGLLRQRHPGLQPALAGQGYRGASGRRRLDHFLPPSRLVLGRSWIEVALLAGSVLLVLIVELLNSAVEATVDRVSMDLHELAKRAKDYGSAAVMLSLLLAGGVWAAALWHRWAA